MCTAPPGEALGGAASRSGSTKATAIAPAISSDQRRRSGSASSTGPTASTAHALLAIASPSSTPASVARPRSAASTAPAHSAAPSSSSGWPMSSARSVIGFAAHSPTTIAIVPRPAPRASRLEASTIAERGAGQQARHPDGAEDRDRSPAQRVRGERERRAHDQRAAVGGAQLEEEPVRAVRERGERRRGLDLVVGEDEAEQAEPGQGRRRRGPRARPTGRSGRDMRTASASAALPLTTRARTKAGPGSLRRSWRDLLQRSPSSASRRTGRRCRR